MFHSDVPPRQARSQVKVLIHGNRLTGALPALTAVMVLTASGNLLEGKLPSTIGSELAMLDLSGVPGRSGGMKGPLPQALCQALSVPWSLRPRKSRGCGDLRPWWLRASCDFEDSRTYRWRLAIIIFLWLVKRKLRHFCSGTVASPLARESFKRVT